MRQCNMWRKNGSVVGLVLGAVVLALVTRVGGASASPDAPVPGRTAPVALTASRGTAVTNRFFGMHAPLLGDRFPEAPVGAVNLTTNGSYWPDLEPSPGVWDFRHLDATRAQASAHHATPLVVLGQTPSFHSTSPDDPSRASVPDMGAWTTYVTEVVTHLAAASPAHVDYQVWPEPNVPNNFTGTPQQMADLVAAAADIIHRISPGATVVAPAMVLRFRSERRFMDAFFRSSVNGTPIGEYVDAVGVDPYPLQDEGPEDALALVTRAQRSLRLAGVTAPLWSLEINYGVPAGGVTPATPLTPRLQASYVIRTYVTSAAADVKRVYWLGWMQYFNLGIQMVEDDEVTPTAAGRAFSRAHTWLVGQRARGCTLDPGTGVYACKLVRDGVASWVYWVESGAARVRAPAGVRRVETMAGVGSRIRPGDPLRVTNAPVRVYR